MVDSYSVILKSLVFVFFLSLSGNAYTQVMGLELLDGKDKLELDIDYAQNFIIVDLRFNHILPLRFILDTGAEHIILFRMEISDILGLQYGKRINLVGSDLDKEVYAYITREVPVQLDKTPTVVRDIIVLEEDFLHLEELTGEAIHGILGSRFFRGLVVQIDYKKGKIILHDASSFEPPANEKYRTVPLVIEKHKPYISSKIVQDKQDTLNLSLLVDTGSALPFLLFLNTHASLQIPEHVVRGNLGRGLGGDLEGYLGRTDRLLLTDHFEFADIITSYQAIDPEIDPEVYRYRNGLVGNPILERFDVMMDFVRSVMYIKPLKKYNRKFKYDKSGLVIYAFGPELNNYYIKQVIIGSPAYKAGIRSGDTIKKIGFWPAGYYTLQGILKKLKSREGKKIRMVLERNGVRYKTSFRLRDYLSEDSLQNN